MCFFYTLRLTATKFIEKEDQFFSVSIMSKAIMKLLNCGDSKSHFLALDDFVSHYALNIRDKDKSSEFYILILNEICSAIADGNIKEFRKVSLFLDYFNMIENQSTLEGLFKVDSNPLYLSNLVILCCKFNQLEILKLVLRNENNVLINCTIGMGGKLDPYAKDKMSKNAFYYAICSQNLELLNIVIGNWPENYLLNNLSVLEDLLSSTYEELTLKNISISKEIECFVFNKLVELRLQSSSLKEKVLGNQPSLDYILDRTNFLLEILTILIDEHSKSQETCDQFLYLAKQVACNIHILKRLLRSTYDLLPWEEMEFCLESFLIANSTLEEINFFYLLVLSKKKIMCYLKSFTEKLREVARHIKKENTWKLRKLPMKGREELINKITKSNTYFLDLYNDHQQIREIYSLERISKYLTLSLSVNASEKEGKLVICRTLQVIGELIKNTVESPNLSTATSQLLFCSLSRDSASILRVLRNYLSHSFPSSLRKELEENSDSQLFSLIQNDSKKIYDAIHSLLYLRKIKIVENAIINIHNSVEDVDRVMNILQLFKDYKIDAFSFGNNNVLNNFGDKYKMLARKFRTTVSKSNFSFHQNLNELEKTIDNYFSRNEKIIECFFEGMLSLKSLCISFLLTPSNILELSREIKKIVLDMSATIEMKSFNPKELSAFIQEILTLNLKSFSEMNSLKSLACELCYLVEFEEGNLKWIKALRDQFKEDHPIPEYSSFALSKNECYNKINSNISFIKLILNKSKSPNHYNFIISDKKLHSIMEMLVLDIMSMMDLTENKLGNNIYLLDSHLFTVTGKLLRNHLAHFNVLYSLIADPTSHLIFTAKILSQLDFNNYQFKIGEVDIVNIITLRDRFYKKWAIIKNQEEMFQSLEKGDMETIQCCLKAGADINAKNKDLWTCFHFAAKSKNVKTLEFVAKCHFNPNVKNVDGHTPLHIASKNGQIENVKYLLLEKKVLINELDLLGKTALHLAVENEFFNIVSVLVENKAKINVCDIIGNTPFEYAVLNNNIDVIELFSTKDKHTYQNDLAGYTPLHFAAEKGFIQLVEKFILETDVNAKSDIGWTPLHAAARFGHKSILITLIKNGADVTASVINGFTALHYAAREGYEEISDILLQNSALVNSLTVEQFTPLHLACMNGHEEVVRKLMKYNANLSATNLKGLSPLHFAVIGGHSGIVSFILNYNIEVNSSDLMKKTPLHYAAALDEKIICELLIQHKAEVNIQDINGFTPLHVAVESGKLSTVNCLLANSAMSSGENKKGSTPLHTASGSGFTSILEILIKLNSSIDSRNVEGYTPLHLAAIKGHENSVALLTKYGANVNSISSKGFSVLHDAVLTQKSNIIKLLIQNGANVNSEGPCSIVPLILAINSGQKDIVRILLANGAKVDGFRFAPLVAAVRENQVKIVKSLIANGADVNIENGAPLSLAIAYGYHNIVDILLKNKALVNINFKSELTPLHIAANLGHNYIIKLLLYRGADINALTHEYGDSPLYQAAKMGFHDVAKTLISNGADINLKSKDGSTSLHVASYFGHVEVVKVLLEHNIKLVQDGENRTALELAVSNGHMDIVKCIIQSRRVDLNSRGNLGFTLLHIAAQEGKLQIIKYLTEQGCDINKTNNCGSKAIHYACREGYKEIVAFFLEKGMSVNEPGKLKQTVLHYAVTGGQLETAEFLIKKGADVNAADANNATPIDIAFMTHFGNRKVSELLFANGALFSSELISFKIGIQELAYTKKLFLLLQESDSIMLNFEDFLKHGVFVNVMDTNFKSPLHYASMNGHCDAVHALLKNNANPNSLDLKHFTPLHYAAKQSHLKIVLYLLSHGAVYNFSADNITPYDVCSDKSIRAILKLLNNSFEDIIENKNNFINDLNQIQDINLVRAIMGAKNEKKVTLVQMAFLNKFSKINLLTQIHQVNINSDLLKAQELFNEGHYQEALSIFELLWEKRKIIFGPNNPSSLELEIHVINAMFNLGNYQRALNMIKNVCSAYEDIFGLDFQNTLSSKSFMALILHKMSKNEEALIIFRDVYHRQKQLLGPVHLDTLESQFHLALVLCQLGDFEEALSINKNLYDIRKSNLGETNPLTVITQNNIALVLTNLKKLKEALHIYEEVYEKKTKIFGIRHKTSLNTLCNIAELHQKLGNNHEAYKMFQEVLIAQKIVLGEDHPDTLFTNYKLAEFFLEQGKLVKAYKTFLEILEPYKIVYGNNNDKITLIQQKLKIVLKILHIQGYDPTIIVNSSLEDDIMKAAINGNNLVMKKLISEGANVNFQDKDGRSPLHLAVSKGHLAVVCLLIQSGASITLLTNKGNSLLHTASLYGHKDIILILLKNVKRSQLPVFINARSHMKSTTALHVAAEKGRVDIVKILLKYGAQYNLKNKENHMPINISKDKNITAFLKFLDEAFTSAIRGHNGLIEDIKALNTDEIEAVTCACNSDGKTLLQVTIQNKHKGLANQLLQLIKK